jgi:gamma-glutamyltranspeptidase/glutathione hydrolase
MSQRVLNAARRACLATPIAIGLIVPALAQDAPVNGEFSVAQPVVAYHAMVVSQEATASRVGLDILKRGGNAVDAAVAVGFALAVTLPRAGNLGGGGFMLIHRADLKKTTTIDYRETAPAAATSDMFLNADGQPDPFKSEFSGLSIGVPGTVAGLEYAWRNYGSGKFSFADLVAPAAKLAHEGLTVDQDLVDTLPYAAPYLSAHATARRIYLKPDGGAPAIGDHIALDDLAATLDRIAADGSRAFYEGPIAEKIAAAVQAAGGRITVDDLKTYRALEREPLRGDYRGHEIVSVPPPSSGGVHIIEILNILEGFPIAAEGLNSAKTIHDMAEAEKLAYVDRSQYLGDPDFHEAPVRGLTSKAYASFLRQSILPDRARPSAEIRPAEPQRFESDQTTHYSIVDEAGNAVSNTYSLNFFYGCGIVADGTGVLLNNTMDDFAAKAGVPNAVGVLGGEANAPGPNKRPLSSMSPTMVFKNGALELVTGSPGGPRIITIVLQIILNVIDHGLNVADAVDAPRVHHQWMPDELRVERGVSADTIRLLQAMGYTVVTREASGSANTIGRSPKEVLTGASDPRQHDTLAIGY